MNKMEELCVNPTQALRLKNLGFNLKCFTRFCSYRKEQNSWYLEDDDFVDWNNIDADGIISAPLFQQAFDWFNDKYNLYSWIENYYNEEFYPKIIQSIHIKRPIPVDDLKILKVITSLHEARIILLDRLLDIVEKLHHRTKDSLELL